LTLDDPPLSFEVKEVEGPRIKKVIIRRRDTEVSSKRWKSDIPLWAVGLRLVLFFASFLIVGFLCSV
jgi:hypothetical protein